MHATRHGKNRKSCSNEFLALFLLEYLWELKERKEIIKISKYSCLLQFIMKTTRKGRSTVYFTFQTFSDTYQEIHLVEGTRSQFRFSCSVAQAQSSEAGDWWRSTFCSGSSPGSQSWRTRASVEHSWSGCLTPGPSKLQLFTSSAFKQRKEKWTLKPLWYL